MDVETKIKEDMRALGCTSETKITLTYHLYIHLVDQKLMYDSEYCYNKDIDVLYVVARPSKKEKINIFVPVTTSFDVSMDFITSLQTNLCTVETGPTINLAFIEGDFSTVIYSFTKGLLSRPSKEKVDEEKTRDARRVFINKELWKNKEKFIQDAFNGGLVADDDD